MRRAQREAENGARPCRGAILSQEVAAAVLASGPGRGCEQRPGGVRRCGGLAAGGGRRRLRGPWQTEGGREEHIILYWVPKLAAPYYRLT